MDYNPEPDCNGLIIIIINNICNLTIFYKQFKFTFRLSSDLYSESFALKYFEAAWISYLSLVLPRALYQQFPTIIIIEKGLTIIHFI